MSLTEPTALNKDAQVESRLTAAVREHWKAFLIEGIVLIVLGTLAIAVPQLTSLVATVFLGWLFVVTGVVGLITSIMARNMPGLWWSVVSAALALAAGMILLIWPLEGTLSLTLIVGAYFLVEGIASIMFAFEHKREMSGRWFWMAIAGVFDMLIAILIILGLPGSAFWTVGLLIGINLIFGGTSLVGMALAAKQGLRP